MQNGEKNPKNPNKNKPNNQPKATLPPKKPTQFLPHKRKNKIPKPSKFDDVAKNVRPKLQLQGLKCLIPSWSTCVQPCLFSQHGGAPVFNPAPSASMAEGDSYFLNVVPETSTYIQMKLYIYDSYILIPYTYSYLEC